MGSVIELRRRASTAVETKPRVGAAAREAASARAEATSIRILVWTFGATAVTMCVIATIMLARTWNELLWAVSFLVVFTLAKIALANGLFYIMVNCDTDRRAAPAESLPSPPETAQAPRRRARRRLSAPSIVTAKRTVPAPHR
jgi:hypothetical protein